MIRKVVISCLLHSALAMLLTSASFAEQSVQAVDQLDIERYMGTWYEIASLPQRFQKGCFATTADYKLLASGKVEILNRCRLDGVDGKLKEAKGSAYVADETSNAKLRVTFFWPFYGDYWVIDLDQDYQYAVVGEPSRQYFWILSRSPNMDDKTFEVLKERAVTVHGYDLSALKKTIH